MTMEALQYFLLRATSYAFFLNATLTVAYAHQGTTLTPKKLLLTLGISLAAGSLVVAIQRSPFRNAASDDADH